MMASTDIAELIRATLADATLDFEDLTGGQDHWRVRVVSAAFQGVSQVGRHRLVYQALGDAMKGPIHALALDTLTPAEAAKG